MLVTNNKLLWRAGNCNKHAGRSLGLQGIALASFGPQRGFLAYIEAFWPTERSSGLQGILPAYKEDLWPTGSSSGLQVILLAYRKGLWPTKRSFGLQQGALAFAKSIAG